MKPIKAYAVVTKFDPSLIIRGNYDQYSIFPKKKDAQKYAPKFLTKVVPVTIHFK